MIRRFNRFIRKVVYRIIPPILPAYGQESFSQSGEDRILDFLFNDYGKKTLTYLDLGTNTPDWGNNTYLFYKKGSTGVCVEADSSLITNIKNVRPKDKVINAGVSVSEEKEADFYIFDLPALNTFDKKEAEYRNSFGNYKIVKVVKVPLISINALIKDNFDTYPDMISIDIEGLDLEVLKSLDFEKYPIPVICIETCIYSENHIRPKDLSIAEFMLTKEYEIYADTYINTIFVNKGWFYSVNR